MRDLESAWTFVGNHSDQMIAKLRRLVQQTSISCSGERVEESDDRLALNWNDGSTG